jgi:hypothetical protein
MGLFSFFGANAKGPARIVTSAADAANEERRKAWQDADKLAALREGEHVLKDSADVAFGSRGYSLHALERAGLMRIERVLRQSPMEDGSWRFIPTDAGRAAAGQRPVEPRQDRPAAATSDDGTVADGAGPQP